MKELKPSRKLRSFYDRLMAHAEDVFENLAKIDLEDIEPEDLRVLQLM